MFGSKPFLHIDILVLIELSSCRRVLGISDWLVERRVLGSCGSSVLFLVVLVQVVLEVLEKSDFFLEFLWEITQGKLADNILLFSALSLNVVEFFSIWFKNDFSGVVEEGSS